MPFFGNCDEILTDISLVNSLSKVIQSAMSNQNDGTTTTWRKSIMFAIKPTEEKFRHIGVVLSTKTQEIFKHLLAETQSVKTQTVRKQSYPNTDI